MSLCERSSDGITGSYKHLSTSAVRKKRPQQYGHPCPISPLGQVGPWSPQSRDRAKPATAAARLWRWRMGLPIRCESYIWGVLKFITPQNTFLKSAGSPHASSSTVPAGPQRPDRSVEEAGWGPRGDSPRSCLRSRRPPLVPSAGLSSQPQPGEGGRKTTDQGSPSAAHARSSVPAPSAGEPTRPRASAASRLAEGRGQGPCRPHADARPSAHRPL